MRLPVACLLLVALAMIPSGCQKKKSSSSSGGGTSACSVTGVTINIGSTTGGRFCQSVGKSTVYTFYDNLVCFNNTNLNFDVSGPNSSGSGSGPAGYVADTGAASCLASVPTTTSSTASAAAHQRGNGKVASFPDGTYARFLDGPYSGGTVTIEYQYPAQ